MMFSYKGGLATWSRQISQAHAGAKKFSSLTKNTQPKGPKTNPNRAQQVDLKKGEILKRPNV